MKRREFIQNGGLGLGTLAFLGPINWPLDNKQATEYKVFISELLKTWGDGMLANQIDNPSDETTHGALMCPSCGEIHGRCMDAVLPFLYLAETTGDDKYLKAGISVFEWSKNVTSADGSWTVMPNPNSWKGISVFGGIALAETLKYHGDILPQKTKEKWTERLTAVSEYIFKTFDLTFTNINYGFTSIYALHLFGQVLNNPSYTERSHELANDIKNWLSEPNKLIIGEGKPSTKKSAKGLFGVDLGYNVEETINAVVQYAVEVKDEELITLLKASLEGHLEFMFPDGAWDNSWGSRQYKWSYWGSRTTDGSQIGYTLLADRNSAFGRAVYQNTMLLKSCTKDGLIHGGPHYISHGVKPCIHHTFCHAKTLATLLNENKNLELINASAKLPIETNYGIKHMPEVDVWLVSHQNWRASISSYDFVYTENSQQATGGSIGFLYHQKIGTIFTASMAKYREVEIYNQQENPDDIDFALSPRIELFEENNWFTNLYDLEAKISHQTNKDKITVSAQVKLKNKEGKQLTINDSDYELKYEFIKEKFNVTAKRTNKSKGHKNAQLVLPIACQSDEKVTQLDAKSIQIKKKNGTLLIKSNVPLEIMKTTKSRVFNLVPGIEAVPVSAHFGESAHEIICTISVS
jgi:hypothetical protein